MVLWVFLLLPILSKAVCEVKNPTCWHDAGECILSDRGRDALQWQEGSLMTPNYCAQLCHYRNKNLSGVKDGNECCCGDAFNVAAVEVVEDGGCPGNIEMSGDETHLPELMRVYSKTTISTNGKPVYQNGPAYLFFSPFDSWRIGPDYKQSDGDLVTHDGDDVDCPTDSEQWFAFTGTFFVPVDLKLANAQCQCMDELPCTGFEYDLCGGPKCIVVSPVECEGLPELPPSGLGWWELDAALGAELEADGKIFAEDVLSGAKRNGWLAVGIAIGAGAFGGFLIFVCHYFKQNHGSIGGQTAVGSDRSLTCKNLRRHPRIILILIGLALALLVWGLSFMTMNMMEEHKAMLDGKFGTQAVWQIAEGLMQRLDNGGDPISGTVTIPLNLTNPMDREVTITQLGGKLSLFKFNVAHIKKSDAQGVGYTAMPAFANATVDVDITIDQVGLLVGGLIWAGFHKDERVVKIGLELEVTLFVEEAEYGFKGQAEIRFGRQMMPPMNTWPDGLSAEKGLAVKNAFFFELKAQHLEGKALFAYERVWFTGKLVTLIQVVKLFVALMVTVTACFLSATALSCVCKRKEHELSAAEENIVYKRALANHNARTRTRPPGSASGFPGTHAVNGELCHGIWPPRAPVGHWGAPVVPAGHWPPQSGGAPAGHWPPQSGGAPVGHWPPQSYDILENTPGTFGMDNSLRPRNGNWQPQPGNYCSSPGGNTMQPLGFGNSPSPGNSGWQPQPGSYGSNPSPANIVGNTVNSAGFGINNNQWPAAPPATQWQPATPHDFGGGPIGFGGPARE